MDTKQIADYLKSNLSEYRFLHTMGVAETAKKLAEKYQACTEKAYIAGLLHDCAKEKTVEDMLCIIEKNGDIPDELSKKSGALLHGQAGAWLAWELYRIDDEIFDSIRYHTTGKANMSLLTKIIYIADFIEPGRKFDGVEEARVLAYSDIDKAIIKSCGDVIVHTVNKGGIVHPHTVEARNYLLQSNGSADDEEIRR